jgi:lysyl-tRNA synthetase class 2
VNADRLRQRAAITTALRRWFDTNGYLEVHTPTLVSSPALEEHLEPVAVGDNFLHTSPEFAMKRVLASGLCRIYQITPCFRDEEVGIHHRREFTMVEWYRANAGTPELMDEVGSLIAVAAEAVDVSPPAFERRSVASLWAALNLSEPEDELSWFQLWVDKIEPSLIDPTIVHGYPAWQAALARERRGRADRFEVYLSGIEIGNCFAEEGDARVLRRRFETSRVKRREMGRLPHPVDESLLEATPRMPRSAGMAIGLDRLVMALTGAKDIQEVQVD